MRVYVLRFGFYLYAGCATTNVAVIAATAAAYVNRSSRHLKGYGICMKQQHSSQFAHGT